VSEAVEAESIPAPPAPAAVRHGPNLIGPAVVLVWLALGAGLMVAPQPGILVFAFVMVGWVLAVMLHEFGHALVAYLGGDHTVRDKGYLSFDPRKYGDVFTTVGLPLIAVALGGIGLPGGAVYLRPDLMRNRRWRAASSLAGPAATLLILLVLCAILTVWARAGASGPLFAALTVLAYLQATALILNLLPIPGLDGFNAISPFLPKSWTPGIRKAEGLAIVALFLAVFLIPGVGEALFRGAARLGYALGLMPEALIAGWSLFRFWA
jgi:Zn-dependent protease